ncbi:unnamed protein product [Leptosia nina]|uniref:Uncharacterized protein n=1 Tax=Leptosia nina TaxID=320188 RepID=A0AAV1IXX5_9NEOP
MNVRVRCINMHPGLDGHKPAAHVVGVRHLERLEPTYVLLYNLLRWHGVVTRVSYAVHNLPLVHYASATLNCSAACVASTHKTNYC